MRERLLTRDVVDEGLSCAPRGVLSTFHTYPVRAHACALFMFPNLPPLTLQLPVLYPLTSMHITHKRNSLNSFLIEVLF